MNNLTSSPQNAQLPDDSVLFFPHEPNLQNAPPAINNPLFLTLPATTNQQLARSVILSPASIENRYSPHNNHCFSSPSSVSTHTKTILKITLPSTKDIPYWEA